MCFHLVAEWYWLRLDPSPVLTLTLAQWRSGPAMQDYTLTACTLLQRLRLWLEGEVVQPSFTLSNRHARFDGNIQIIQGMDTAVEVVELALVLQRLWRLQSRSYEWRRKATYVRKSQGRGVVTDHRYVIENVTFGLDWALTILSMEYRAMPLKVIR